MDTNEKEDNLRNQELMWDSHSDEDFGDLLDFIMKNMLSENSVHQLMEYNYEGNNLDEDFEHNNGRILKEADFLHEELNRSLLKKIQAYIDLQPGFPCVNTRDNNKTLSEIVRRQIILDEIRTKLNENTLKIYARRHNRNSKLRRQFGYSFLIPVKIGLEMHPSYFALIEKMNPDLFNKIHDGELDQIPSPPDDIQYLSRLGQYIDIFERVLLSDPVEYNREEAYILQMEYDRVYDLLFSRSISKLSLIHN
ncbi:hypothetical protein RB195_000425 [Necator americanus]|uniref:Uncharacterized protein n=1 Tax=Necator americanus TaxID=51031 RepID=A0ABR1D9P0_NECAM